MCEIEWLWKQCAFTAGTKICRSSTDALHRSIGPGPAEGCSAWEPPGLWNIKVPRNQYLCSVSTSTERELIASVSKFLGNVSFLLFSSLLPSSLFLSSVLVLIYNKSTVAEFFTRIWQKPHHSLEHQHSSSGWHVPVNRFPVHQKRGF